MERRLWSLAGTLGGMLLALGAFRMFDGGAPWPLAALAAGAGLIVLVLGFRQRWNRKERRPEHKR
ncbi:hypothetical protein OL239_04535 [Arthrobacter sp. ATA002]|uniref:hypothetical protein n=1 Tax=Arthrobacter sp. ATA002 TaxID=2991715 RepID=UPI0022A6DE59|nr:hypothetical protein [Arthrobacter sp. ATA002]WAP52521.1 hypothetical protein OL239_04535 [Arthrobacter sp. ATA002]